MQVKHVNIDKADSVEDSFFRILWHSHVVNYRRKLHLASIQTLHQSFASYSTCSIHFQLMINGLHRPPAKTYGQLNGMPTWDPNELFQSCTQPKMPAVTRDGINVAGWSISRAKDGQVAMGSSQGTHAPIKSGNIWSPQLPAGAIGPHEVKHFSG